MLQLCEPNIIVVAIRLAELSNATAYSGGRQYEPARVLVAIALY